jgi:hypothetical protein
LKLCIAILTVLMALVGGCSTHTNTTVLVVRPMPSYSAAVVTPDNGNYEWKITGVIEKDDSILAYPPKIKVSNVTPGDVLTFSEHNEFCYYIENRSDSIQDFTLTIESPVIDTTDADSGLIYKPCNIKSDTFTPIDFSVPAYSKVQIPITLAVPKLETLPKRWEIDFKAANNSGGFINTAYMQRWLITMR